MILSSSYYRKPPSSLGHHTKFDSMCSILSGGEGQDQEICIWAVSNKYKNDKEELKMGEIVLNTAKKKLESVGKVSLLQKISGYENSGSVSFMEGEPTKYMMDNYGCIRLNFDFRGIEVSEAIWNLSECEYIMKKQIHEYAERLADDMLQEFNTITSNGLPNIDAIISFLQSDIDVCRKLFLIKAFKWRKEQEWRIVRDLNGTSLRRTEDGAPYVKVFLPAKSLKQIVVMSSRMHDNSETYNQVKDFISSNSIYSHVKIVERKVTD